MRNSFPKRPTGTHTWVAARFLPVDRAILFKYQGHVIVYCHPDSLYAGNQRHIHQMVNLSEAMSEGSVDIIRQTQHVSAQPRHARNLSNYMSRSVNDAEVPVFMTAYATLAQELPTSTREYLRDVVRECLLPVA